MITVFYTTDIPSDIPSGISDHRKNKILNCTAPCTRTEQMRTAALLKRAFKHFGIEESTALYALGENGKPYIKNAPQFRFSISHTSDMSVVTIYDTEIGIDCEISDRVISKSVLSRFFTDTEVTSFQDCHLLLWVAKESLVKLSGMGLSEGRKEFPLTLQNGIPVTNDAFINILQIAGHTISVATYTKDDINVIHINI